MLVIPAIGASTTGGSATTRSDNRNLLITEGARGVSDGTRSATKQPGAQVDLGDGVVAEVVAVHPISPDVDTPQWEREIKDLSRAAGEHGLRILAGDFNATLDHAAFRTVLSRGYNDAAEQRGSGLSPTWPSSMPVVTIDHVVVDNRAAVRDYRVFDVQGSDHHAVFAEVQLP